MGTTQFLPQLLPDRAPTATVSLSSARRMYSNRDDNLVRNTLKHAVEPGLGTSRGSPVRVGFRVRQMHVYKGGYVVWLWGVRVDACVALRASLLDRPAAHRRKAIGLRAKNAIIAYRRSVVVHTHVLRYENVAQPVRTVGQEVDTTRLF